MIITPEQRRWSQKHETAGRNNNGWSIIIYYIIIDKHGGTSGNQNSRIMGTQRMTRQRVNWNTKQLRCRWSEAGETHVRWMNRKTLETGRRGREGVERKQSEEELRKQPIKQIQDRCGGKIRRQEGKLNTGQKTPEKPRKHIKLTYSETKQQNQDTSWRLC